MEALAFAFFIIVDLVWLIVIVACGFRAMDGWYDYGAKAGLPWAVATLLIIALPIGFFMSLENDEPAGLCLRGHQEYRTSHGAVPVGKVIVPTTSTYKAWVCEQREQ